MELNEFNKWLLEKGRSKNTAISYCYDMAQFLDICNKDVKDIGKDDIDKYRNFLKEEKYKMTSINRKLVALNQYVRFLNTLHNTNINISIDGEKFQKVDYLETQVLTENEFYRIVKQAEKVEDIRATTILYTLYLTGMRVSEMLQLKLNDIENDEFIVKGKGSKYRIIFIPDVLRDIWREYLIRRINKSEYLFTGERGAITRGTVNAIVRKYTGLARIKIEKGHPHSIRHLYGYSVVKEGWSLDRVASQMGHSNINTTKIYTLPPKSEMKKDINNFAKNKIIRSKEND